MSWTRIAAARRLARIMLLVAGLLTAVAGVLVVQSPVVFGGTGIVPHLPTALTPALGLAGMLVGLGWMWRLYRAPTTFEASRWRYRDR